MEKNQELPKSSSWYQYFGLYNEQTKVPLPLKRIFVNVTFNEYIAEITYSQLYYNNQDNHKIETEYFFPISSSACFHKLTAKFGSTIIESMIKEKSEAKQLYEGKKKSR